MHDFFYYYNMYLNKSLIINEENAIRALKKYIVYIDWIDNHTTIDQQILLVKSSIVIGNMPVSLIFTTKYCAI